MEAAQSGLDFGARGDVVGYIVDKGGIGDPARVCPVDIIRILDFPGEEDGMDWIDGIYPSPAFWTVVIIGGQQEMKKKTGFYSNRKC